MRSLKLFAVAALTAALALIHLVGGVNIASRADQPDAMRSLTMVRFIPACAAHCVTLMVLPSIVIQWVLDRFVDCTAGVAHRMFPGSYPLDPSIRSSVSPGGLGPISDSTSATKLSLDSSQRSHMRIPFSLYHFAHQAFGLFTLVLTLFQSFLSSGWERLTRPLGKQPHDCTQPDSIWCRIGAVLQPQAHMQGIRITAEPPGCVARYGAPMTRSFPNFLPASS